MDELAAVRALVDRAEQRLLDEQPHSPLLRRSGPERRRILAVAAFRELRALRRMIDEESPRSVDGA